MPLSTTRSSSPRASQAQTKKRSLLWREGLLCASASEMAESFEPRLASDASQKKVLLCSLDEVGRGCIAGPVVTCASFWTFGFEMPSTSLARSQDLLIPLLSDSKKLSPKQREHVSDLFLSHWKLSVFPSVFSEDLPFSGIKPWPKSHLKSWAEPENGSKSHNAQGGLALHSASLGYCSAPEIDRANIWGAVQWSFNRALLEGLRSHQMLSEAWENPKVSVILLMDGNLAIGLHQKLFRNGPLIQWVAKGGDGLFPSIGLSSILAKTHRDSHVTELGKIFPGYGFEGHKGYGTPAHFSQLRQLPLTPEHRRSFLKNL